MNCEVKKLFLIIKLWEITRLPMSSILTLKKRDVNLEEASVSVLCKETIFKVDDILCRNLLRDLLSKQASKDAFLFLN